MKELPEGAVSTAAFEGANIVLYTKDKDFFLENRGIIRTIVQKIKKRIELRADTSMTMEEDQIIFDKQRSVVYIETEKPGVAIGKSGANLRDIREQTRWTPVVRRTPPIRSQVVEDIRAVLYLNNDDRRKFLDRVGHRIVSEKSL